MNCEDVQELLGNFIDEELTQAMSRRVGAHVATCAACRADLASLQETVARLHGAPAVEAPNMWSFERLLDRLARDHDAHLAPQGAPARLTQLSFNINIHNEENR